MPAVSDELIAAYRATEYRVDAPGIDITLRIDQYNPHLAALHDTFRIRRSAFLTAWNPYSVPTTLEENIGAQRSLLIELKSRNHHWLRGAGIDPAGVWPPEPSVLVLGIPQEEASDLAKRFRQNGFVFCGADAIPRLVLAR